MIFGRKATKNNWFGGNSLFPVRKRRNRNLSSPKEVLAVKGEDSGKNQGKGSFLLPLLGFRGRNRKKTTSMVENQGKYQSGNSRYSQMSNTGILPIWLMKLYQANDFSSIITLLLVLSTLTVYGLTVYSQQLWSSSYKRLRQLQRHERQLNTANATLTNKIAEDGEKPKAGMATVSPESAIFINPMPENATKPSVTHELDKTVENKSPTPLGY